MINAKVKFCEQTHWLVRESGNLLNLLNLSKLSLGEWSKLGACELLEPSMLQNGSGSRSAARINLEATRDEVLDLSG